MTQDEIIEMARQSGAYRRDIGGSIEFLEVFILERFAKLVAEKEREACAKLIAKLTEMLEIQQKLHETAIDMLKPAIEAEREACAKLLEATDLGGLKDNPAMQSWVAEMLLAYVNAIRARGQA